MHNYFAYNFVKVRRALRMKSGNGVTDRLSDIADLFALWRPMSGSPQEQRDRAVQQSRTAPLDFAQGSLRYARQMRRHRERRYRLVAALVILGVVAGVVAVLLADWLNK